MSDCERFAQIAPDKWPTVTEPMAQVAHVKRPTKIVKSYVWYVFCTFFMSDSLISSFLMSDVSESLRSLTKNEWPWVICSGRSEEMSDVSESLFLLTKNHEKWANHSFFWVNRSFFDKKRAIRSEINWVNSQPCSLVIIILYCKSALGPRTDHSYREGMLLSVVSNKRRALRRIYTYI